MKKSGKTSAGRRKFLKGAALGGVATLVAGKESVRAQQSLVAGHERHRFPQCRRLKQILRARSVF